MPNIHPELTVDRHIRIWSYEQVSAGQPAFTKEAASDFIAAASLLADWILSGGRPLPVNGPDSVGDKLKGVASVSGMDILPLGRGDSHDQPLGETLSGISHNHSPVVGLDAATVSQAGGGVNAPVGEG